MKSLKRFSILIVLAVALFATPLFADGKVFVLNDEWVFSDNTWDASAAQLTNNVVQYFGGSGGSFYADSDDFGLTGSDLAAQMASQGITWGAGMAGFGAFTLANLEQYTAVFFSAEASSGYDASILTQYVEAGGDVLIEGGTGEMPNGAVGEADYWNPTLNDFGLQFATSYNNLVGNIPISSSNPLLAGVTSIYIGNGQDITYAVPSDTDAQIIDTYGSDGLYAVTDLAGSEFASSTPEPGTLLLLGSGIVAIGKFPRRKIAAQTKN